MQETSVQTASILTSLLFLAVLKMSDIARNMELKKVAQSEHPPFFFLLPPLNLIWNDEADDVIPLPRLGRFNFLHGVNTVLLVAGFWWFFHTYQGWNSLKLVGILSTGGGLLLLPIFEVDEYDSILKTGQKPKSFYYHLIGSLFFLIAIAIMRPLMETLSSRGLPVYHYDFDIYVFLMSYITTYIKFLLSLQSELKIVNHVEPQSQRYALT